MKEKEHEIFQAPLSLVKEDYYLVTYEGQLWPGQLMKPTNSGAIIRCLLKAPVTVPFGNGLINLMKKSIDGGCSPRNCNIFKFWQQNQ